MKTWSARSVANSSLDALTTVYSIMRWSPLKILPIAIKTEGWGQRRRITFGRPFEVPIDTVVPPLEFAQLEIDAFVAGEPSISLFFKKYGAQRGLSPEWVALRKLRTPALLRADPAAFVVSVYPLRGGRLQVVDGSHRLAIARAKGFASIKVQFVLRQSFRLKRNRRKAEFELS